MGDQGTKGSSGVLPSSARRALRLLSVLGAIYLFLAAISAFETGVGMLGQTLVDRVFEAVSDPFAGMAAGLLATVMIQSSSATTSIIVGLVGAGVITVEAAVPMVLGANIGSAVTSTLASLGNIRQGVYFERGFAAATMQDFYNILAVTLFLPLEVGFHIISRAARVLADWVRLWAPDSQPASGGFSFGDFVDAPAKALEGLIEGWAWGTAGGVVMIGLAVGTLVFALVTITRLMKSIASSRIEGAVNAILSRRGGAMAVVVGLVTTLIVQSSGIVNAIMVPLAASGILSLPNAFPIILGADLGTTATAVLASTAASSPEALVIAMAHVVINFVGIFIFYPMRVRQVPIRLALWLSRTAMRNKTWVAVYILTVFVVAPVLILILS